MTTPSTFRATVLRNTRITPRMARVTVGGPGLRGFTSTGRPDEYSSVHLPGPGEREPADSGRGDRSRHYTIRRHDPRLLEVDLDVVIHDGGIGAAWGATAAPGDVVALDAPGGGNYRPPADAAWLLLVGDATALPAIGRVVEGLPAGMPAMVHAVVADAAEHQTWATAGAVEVDWVHEPDPDRVGAVLLDVARAAARPPGEGFTWVAGENVGTRLVRRHLRHDLGLPGRAYATMGYWRPRAEEWEARYAAVAPAVEEKLAAADRAFPDDEEYADAVEAIYEDAGL